MKHKAQCSITDYYGLAKSSGYLRLICSIIVPLITCRYKTNSLHANASSSSSRRQDDIFNVSIWVKQVERSVSATMRVRGSQLGLLMRQGQEWQNNVRTFRCNAHLAHVAGKHDVHPLWRTQLGWDVLRHLSWIDTALRPGLTREQLPTPEK